MKIGIIIKREYMTRVRKRSFIILTILTPILFAALMVLPAILMEKSESLEKQKSIAVLDETNIFYGKLENTDANVFLFVENEPETLKELVKEGVYDAFLYIPATSSSVPVNAKLYSERQMSMNLTSHIKTMMKKEIEHQKLMASGIDPAIVKSATTDINVQTIRFSDGEGEDEEKAIHAEFEFMLGMFLATLIYFIIFLFGNNVMRGVIEEKTNRIIEVIVSSVKPFELMMGKIIGLALVGLTQMLLWVVITLILYFGFVFMTGTPQVSPAGTVMTEQIGSAAGSDTEMVQEVLEIVNSVNFSAILWSFVAFFIGGYLLYAAMFAAAGSAVDSETDSQQFTLPISIPLILGIVCSASIANSPDSSLAVWLSMIPFTSPVAMMLRVPFGVPYWQVGVSLSILYISFIIMTWVAAKIYRTGILMYGKKITYKELWKWLRY